MTSLMYCKVNESTKQQHQQLPQTMTNNGREIATAYKANLVPVFSLLCAVYPLLWLLLLCLLGNNE